MSEAIDRMLAEARARTRARAGPWWDRITPADLPAIYRESWAQVGLSERAASRVIPGPPGAAISESLVGWLGRVYTWRAFFRAHIGQTKRDPQRTIVRDLREFMSRPHA